MPAAFASRAMNGSGEDEGSSSTDDSARSSEGAADAIHRNTGHPQLRRPLNAATARPLDATTLPTRRSKRAHSTQQPAHSRQQRAHSTQQTCPLDAARAPTRRSKSAHSTQQERPLDAARAPTRPSTRAHSTQHARPLDAATLPTRRSTRAHSTQQTRPLDAATTAQSTQHARLDAARAPTRHTCPLGANLRAFSRKGARVLRGSGEEGLTPGFGLGDLVEREQVQAGHAEIGIAEVPRRLAAGTSRGCSRQARRSGRTCRRAS